MKHVTIILITMILFIALYFDCHQKYHHLSRPHKALIMPFIILMYAVLAKDIQGLQMFAMVFGWLGDIFLLRDEKIYFMTGGVSFMIGHACYGILYLQQIDLFHLPVWIYSCILVYLLMIVVVFRYLKPYVKKEFGLLVIVYMVFISMMSFFALARFPFVDRVSWLLVWIGSLVFMVSDTLVATEKFVNPKLRGVMETYVPAQLLLMFGMTFHA